MQRTHVPTSHHYITAEAYKVSGYRQIQMGLRGRKRKDGAHPRSLGSRLGGTLPEGEIITGGLYIAMPASGVMHE